MTLTLRKKTLVVVTLTLIALVVILYFAISSIVMGSFEDLEKDDVSRHVERVNEAIDNELSDINSKLVDWAKPGQDLDVVRLANLLDDERARVSDQRSNRLADLMANLDINVFLWTDSSDSIFWGWAYDEESQGLDFVPKGLRDELTSDSPLLRHAEGSIGVRGMVLLPERGPMLVVSTPILYHVEDGPVENGSMMMGKFLDEREVARVAELTRLDVAVRRLDKDLTADFQEARSALATETDIYPDPLDDDFIAGYSFVNDVRSAPALLWRVKVPRDIIDEGNKSINFLLIALVVVVGVVLVVVIAFLLDRLVLSRMASLNTQVSGINMTSALDERVSVPGNDELSNLGVTINGMLEEIQTERGKSEAVLLNVLPAPIAERLKAGEAEGEKVIADSFRGSPSSFPTWWASPSFRPSSPLTNWL